MSEKSSYPPEARIPTGSPFFDIIEDAYRVFACPKPESRGVCEHCCMDAVIERDFFRPDIKSLPLRYVRDWYSAAYDPEGVPKRTWTYLLPRILEILAVGEDVASLGLEVSLSRFATGNPEKWSPTEWGVLDRFQRMYLAQAVEGGPDRLDDVICMFALGGWDVRDLIDQVAAARDEALARRFWNDWCKHSAAGRESIRMTTFWNSAGKSAVYEFYTSEGLYGRMEALALADDTDAELAAKASAVAEVIAVYR